MQENFKTWITFAWKPDNDGQPDHTEDMDPGGETNFGVTFATWQHFARRGYVTGSLASASQNALMLVLRLDCWHPCQCDILPSGIDILIADMAMVAGPGAAAKCLQRTVGVADDGDIGPLTLAAIKGQGNDLLLLIQDLLRADDEYYAALRQFRLWGRGWERRAADCAKLSKALVGPAFP